MERSKHKDINEDKPIFWTHLHITLYMRFWHIWYHGTVPYRTLNTKSLFPFIDSLVVVHLCTQITKRAQGWYRIVQPRLWCSQELLALPSKLGRWSTATNLDVSVGTASGKLGWFWPRNTSICIKMIGTRALSIVSVPHEQGKYSNNCEYCPGHSLTVSH